MRVKPPAVIVIKTDRADGMGGRGRATDRQDTRQATHDTASTARRYKMSKKTITYRAPMMPGKNGQTNREYIAEFLEEQWQQYRTHLFRSAVRRCVKSTCKQFKFMLMELLKKYKGDPKVNIALVFTSSNLTDYTAESGQTLEQYARGIFHNDKKVVDMCEKKGMVISLVRVREMSLENEKGEVKERVSVICGALLTKSYYDAIVASGEELKDKTYLKAAPAKSNAPSMD
jgi:hypothetical protein